MTDRELLELILKNQTETNTRLDNVEVSLSEIKKKNDITHDPVFRNTEAIPEINIKVDRIADDVDFLKQMEFENKQDIFKLKKNLQIVK